ncbi:uncharacterized protein LOC123686095 isoform X1 [Harmonia axyridis]|uniref:uncharacterized protein LOC123686095 isoform X1 n=1 Tax=Harmonia axyridis TaxID=115357 RepID=UPI001E27711A|nr:uncharacterized protein LOC123686095 isoform X1 [Harmonia axyridis]
MSENLDKCLSCDNYFLPPIYQCPRGHTLCSHCTQDAQYMISTSEYNLRQAKLKSVTKVKLFCGSCMNFYFINEELRNEDIERSVEAVKYPCTFKKDGCQFEDIYTKIKTHNETCCFMVISCFWKNCYWIGPLRDMKLHLKLHSEMNVGHNEPFVNNSCYTIFHEDSFYLLKILLTQKYVEFFVIYHGEPNKYLFEINIGTKFSNRYPIKLRKVIPPLKSPKIHGFNSHNAEVFLVDFEFVEQFIAVEREKIYDEVQYMIQISPREEQNSDF